jgi:hypothetical protein
MSSFAYFASFDVANALDAFGTVTVSSPDGADVVVNMATLTSSTFTGGNTTSVYNHSNISLVGFTGEDLRLTGHLSSSFAAATFGGRLASALNTAATAASWAHAGSFTVTLDATTLLYTIVYGTGMTQVAFSTASGRKLLGYAANFGPVSAGAAQTSVVATRTPNFVISPTLPAVSMSTPNYEPTGIASQAASDSGEPFGISRTISPLYRDWTQQYETKAKTLRLAAAASHPFTFQELFERCRTVLPFIVVNGFGESYDEMFYFRADGASMSKSAIQRASDANDAQFHVSFGCLVIGNL